MVLQNAIRFVVVLLLQGLVFNHVSVGAYIYPAIYVYFILLLPYETKGWVLLLSSFLLGLGVDFFSNSLGLHAAAAVSMAFLRPLVIRLLTSGKDYEILQSPGIKTSGFSWFMFYSAILILIHHTLLFFLESFSFAEFSQTLLRVLFSSLATLFLVLTGQFLFYKPEKH